MNFDIYKTEYWFFKKMIDSGYEFTINKDILRYPEMFWMDGYYNSGE